MKKPRRNHAPAFKARMALEVLRGEKTVAQLSALHGVHPTQLTSWKNHLLERRMFITGSGKEFHYWLTQASLDALAQGETP